ncbi:uncharacterized protein BO80DRAFT_446846 [Aspergillus ibericus CBS 121593]|uniref:Uncharacterized protein n=1 Tax=Aspergillus ibericus CBS 121593 TaxID=1448316 RepID=A0A395GV17_9EURO|nr:hypothetical protein BO80DRAFT_446846 [Aspergillus ibericus CBS 121593]RAK99014.1 hypothetical protein BO80DRAFT_446846 [Aspergillus ibericus CBS 121593]
MQCIEFEIEITYTTRRPSDFYESDSKLIKLNEVALTEHAFRAKTSKIRLEHGRFFTQWETQRTGIPGWAHPYAWRLVFDSSPYLPREEWTMAWGEAVLDEQRFWERTELCAQGSQLPREGGLWNDIKRWLGYP